MKTNTHATILLLVFFAGMHTALADTHTVDAGGEADFTTIQAAIDTAVYGDTVQVAAGTYIENITLKNGVALIGEVIGEDPNNTIIDGNAAGSVVYSNACDPNTILEGFTLTGGFGTVISSWRYGGGMFNINSSPTVVDCILKGNTATGDGGGMYNTASSPTVTGCSFSGNSADYAGGGMDNRSQSHPIVTDCNFIDNTAGTHGGGMENIDNSSSTVTGCTFSGNYAPSYGGGMYNYQSSPTMTNCTFNDNQANDGGGMFNYTSSPTVIDCTFDYNSSLGNGGGMENFHESHSTVTNCTFSGNDAAGYGGGMHNRDNSSPTMTNCTFSDNTAGTYGGGMENYQSSPTMTNCTFNDNQAHDGGGMFNYTSSPTVIDCTFDCNFSPGNGGGMENFHESHSTVTNCTFHQNEATGYGGGMHNRDNSSPTMTNCTFSDNTADNGGGVFNYQSSPDVAQCVFSNNKADSYDGGGMENYDHSSPTVTDCDFNSNSAVQFGGGMQNKTNSNPTVANCTFSDNQAHDGGGMFNYTSSPTVINCTFADNSSLGNGGGMENFDESYSTVTNCTFSGNDAAGYGGGMHNRDNSNPIITNCILWGDTPDEISNLISSTPVVSYSDVQGGCPGTGNIETDPNFIDPDNPDPNLVDLHLDSNSPCIDAGDNASVPVGISTDLDSQPRFEDDPATIDTGNGTPPAVDMGAYEFKKRIYNVTQNIWYSTIQTAIHNAANSDQIEVAPGTYYESINFEGKAVHLYSSDGPEATVINGTGHYHVVQCVSGEDPNTILEGFTITGGKAEGYSNPHDRGGGMYCQNSSPTVTRCIFTANTAVYGGGMCNRSAGTVVMNCFFYENAANLEGGAVFNEEASDPDLINSTFTGNNAGNGGGIHNVDSQPIVTNCILWNDMPNEVSNWNSISTITYSNIKGGWIGEGNIDKNPLFRAVSKGGLSLAPWSPCIDTGSNTVVPPDAVDIAGLSRLVDGDCNDIITVDMGAQELTHAHTGDFDSNCRVNLQDLAFLARAWLAGPLSAYWDPVCDISTPADKVVDTGDLTVFTENWLQDVLTPTACDPNQLIALGMDASVAIYILQNFCGIDDIFTIEQLLYDGGYEPAEYLEFTALESVRKFAPVLYFDQAHKGLPMSAQLYFETVMTPVRDVSSGTITWNTPWDGPCGKPGVSCLWGRDECTYGMHNNDFSTLVTGQVPTYYKVISDIDSEVDTGPKGRLRIAYWWFYGFQPHCNIWEVGEDGAHHGDWEFVWITTDVSRSRVDAITYCFHGVWYTRKWGGFSRIEDRPVVYVGKLGHGNYHNDDHSGWMVGTPSHCCHYADYKDATVNSKWYNTYDNLVSLSDSEPWMLADRKESTYDYYGNEYTILPWRWGPHISYCNLWFSGLCTDWEHELACGTHPTVDYPLDWDIASCKDEGCRDHDCKGLVYTPPLPDYNQGWPWESGAASSAAETGDIPLTILIQATDDWLTVPDFEH